MADNQAVWGIEIGQAGLKAIRLRYAEAAGQVIAAAFDYVPHPKLLSQPDAAPDELIRQALDTFLARNKIGGDLIAIGLPGQTALAKFIQLPPVEAGRVAEIVKYEARQQIPFALEDVEWDFQTLGGGDQEAGGFMLDAEVGLFAMKKEQVAHHLKPFLDRKVEVEVVQIAPLALFNFLCYDRYGIRLGGDRPGIEDYTVMVDMGADNSSLLVTNGTKIWIRNVPIGGNHFTRALTKEMKLTFAKAEHLKCNATKSPDPRAVFQALRPIFNDYVSEIQRSIGYFSSVNRTAKIGRLIGVGNGFKLAGLQKFLQQNLQYEVDRVDHFQGLVGDHVLTAPLFQDNLLTFVVPYGLALQALKLTDIHTTLLPREIAVSRLIRRKKPWAVATAASLLCGMAISTAGYGNVWHSVSTERFGDAEKQAADIASEAGTLKSKYGAEESRNTTAKAAGDQLVGMLPTREMWLEIFKSINECLPRDVGEQLDEEEIMKKHRISLSSITCKKYADLSAWYSSLAEEKKLYMTDEDKAAGPTGSGYVFTLHGHHYHHEPTNPKTGQGHMYEQNTLLANLKKPVVEWKDPFTGNVSRVDVRRAGISHATETYGPNPKDIQFWPNGRPGMRQNQNMMNRGGFGGAGGFPGSGTPSDLSIPLPGGAPMPGSGVPFRNPRLQGGGPGGLANDESVKSMVIKRTVFTIQFAWVPTPVEKRKEIAADAPPVDPNAIVPAAVDGVTPPATTNPPAAPATQPGPAAPTSAPMP
ncbi:MAG TPA: type IV pilus assembly protein PilM [Planctomycetaceae bacterium]|nr:type IV pilus assembly protein PilM [Planctomycetaceae bacterium]